MSQKALYADCRYAEYHGALPKRLFLIKMYFSILYTFHKLVSGSLFYHGLGIEPVIFFHSIFLILPPSCVGICDIDFVALL
jgi:hypothetical protein